MQNKKVDIKNSIKESFIVLKNNPIILIPIIISATLWYIFYYFTVYAFFPEEIPTFIQEFTEPEYLFYFYLLALASLFPYGMVSRMVYVANKKGKTSLFEEAKIVARKYIFLLIAGSLFYLITSLTYIAFVIPIFIIPILSEFIVALIFISMILGLFFVILGFFFFVKLFYFDYAILIDDEKVVGSLKKSWQITKGNWWRTLGLLAFFIIPVIILSFIAMTLPSPIALVIDYIAFIIWGWMYSAFTIAYLQLTEEVKCQEN